MIRLYTQPKCPFCDIMKQKLDAAGLVYTTIDISEDYEAKMFLKDRGHRTVPQLYSGDNHLNEKDTVDYTIEELREIVAKQTVDEMWAWQDSGVEQGI
jgi:glutaredoxin-like protein NrdH